MNRYSPHKAPTYKVRTKARRARDWRQWDLEFGTRLLEERQHWQSLKLDKVKARKEATGLDDQSGDEEGGDAEVMQEWEATYGPRQMVGEEQPKSCAMAVKYSCNALH